MSYDPSYRFPGMPAFLKAEGFAPSASGKIHGMYFVARIADALAQTGEARPEHRAAIFEEAIRQRAALNAALAMCDAAIAEVRDRCFPPPEPEPKPEPRRRQAPKPELLPEPEPEVSPEQP